MKVLLQRLIPSAIWHWLRRAWETLRRVYETPPVRWVNRQLLKLTLRFMKFDAQVVKILNTYGLNVSQSADFYSPLPLVSNLEKTVHRWSKPSELIGIDYSLPLMKSTLQLWLAEYLEEYEKKADYNKINAAGYGPGYPFLDSMLLYFMIRDRKPKNYIEIGSGVSTYYCSMAAKENIHDGIQTRITCIDPYPHKMLYNIPQINIVNQEIQDVDISYFNELHCGDILFIDSTHIVKIDGDVPYLYLEVIPRLRKGVIIHVHDIPFPYNIPYPPQYYVFGGKRPVFWNEAMLLQAFLCFNDSYRIIMSIPLMRYFDEQFLRQHISNYAPVSLERTATHAGSIWIEKVK